MGAPPGRSGRGRTVLWYQQVSSVFSWLPDYSKGFGGKYGIDKDKVDKSAVGFEYQGKTEKHESQKGWCGGSLGSWPPPRAVGGHVLLVVLGWGDRDVSWCMELLWGAHLPGDLLALSPPC